MHEGTLLHEDNFERRVTFERRNIFARRHFCTMSHFCTKTLLVEKFLNLFFFTITVTPNSYPRTVASLFFLFFNFLFALVFYIHNFTFFSFFFTFTVTTNPFPRSVNYFFFFFVFSLIYLFFFTFVQNCFRAKVSFRAYMTLREKMSSCIFDPFP